MPLKPSLEESVVLDIHGLLDALYQEITRGSHFQVADTIAVEQLIALEKESGYGDGDGQLSPGEWAKIQHSPVWKGLFSEADPYTRHLKRSTLEGLIQAALIDALQLRALDTRIRALREFKEKLSGVHTLLALGPYQRFCESLARTEQTAATLHTAGRPGNPLSIEAQRGLANALRQVGEAEAEWQNTLIALGIGEDISKLFLYAGELGVAALAINALINEFAHQ